MALQFGQSTFLSRPSFNFFAAMTRLPRSARNVATGLSLREQDAALRCEGYRDQSPKQEQIGPYVSFSDAPAVPQCWGGKAASACAVDPGRMGTVDRAGKPRQPL